MRLSKQFDVLDFWIVIFLFLSKFFVIVWRFAAAHFFLVYAASFFSLNCCYVHITPFFPQGFKADFLFNFSSKWRHRIWNVRSSSALIGRWQHNFHNFPKVENATILSRWFSATESYTRPPVSKMSAKAVATLAKPKMRGLLTDQIKMHLVVATVLSFGTMFAYKFLVADQRKLAYAEFYRTYDIEKEYNRMKQAGIFTAARPA